MCVENTTGKQQCDDKLLYLTTFDFWSGYHNGRQ